jgi:F0F1-type ATP synthase assembly protein I
LDTGIRRLLLNQLLLVGATSAVFLVIFDLAYAVSAGFGGGIAAVNALLVWRCARRDARAPERTPQQSLTAIYICVIQRFVFAALLFALGLGVLELKPFPLLSGFIAGQIVMVIIGTQQLKQK